MDRSRVIKSASPLPVDRFPSPCFVLDLARLRANMSLMGRIQNESGCRILLALKGFATWVAFDTMRTELAGTCASGLWEARLGREKFGGELHTYSPAIHEDELDQILELSDHLTFNSLPQWERLGPQALRHPRAEKVKLGFRVNPGVSTGHFDLYNPCAPGSRLGIPIAQLEGDVPEGISGLHMHTLCEQGPEPLALTLAEVEERLPHWLKKLEWFNMGGGHHMTHPDYDVEHLIQIVSDFAKRWDLQVYLEPGEAQVFSAGYLIGSVMDLFQNDINIAVLNVSATAHLADVLEMPYRPEITNTAREGERPHTYRLGGPTCLSGDFFGQYSFDKPLKIGDRVVFEDQAQYTMVKTTMFNGIPHPAIATWDADTGEVRVVREFQYEDYRDRLG